MALDQDHFLVVGLDFGTTYSGVAWAQSKKPHDIRLVGHWPTDSSAARWASESEKVPTEIVYENGSAVRWGFGVRDDDRPIRWFKLLLARQSLQQLDGAENEQIVKDIKADLASMRKSAADVIADYLSLLWQHVLKELTASLTSPTLDNLVIRVVITTPALWETDARNMMKSAAKKAGILKPRRSGATTLRFVSEPEAAALATFGDAAIEINPAVKNGDAFVVCDAGGGTVDLITYSIAGMNPLRLSQVVETTGRLCGAVYLDEAFRRHIFGLHKYMAKLDPKDLLHFMKKEWEGPKRSYQGGSAEQHSVTLPLMKHTFKNKGGIVVALNKSQLDVIFTEVVSKVLDLVNFQVGNARKLKKLAPKLVILVGGFGDNRYLFKRMKEQFPAMHVQQPNHGWSAIARGAVLKGFEGTTSGQEVVRNHVVNYSYGSPYATDFIQGRHELEDKIFDEKEQSYKTKRIKWHLQKGTDVLVSAPTQFHYYQLLETSKELQKVCVVIHRSDVDQPSIRFKASEMHELCHVKFSLDEDDFTSLKVFQNSKGQTFRRLHFILDVKVTASSIDWQIVFDGKPVETSVVYREFASSPR